MTQLPPIDRAIAFPEPRFPKDDEPKRLPRIALQHLADHDGSHDYAYSWGYTIFRTVYTPGSDEAVARAVDRLAVYAKHWARTNERSRPRLGQPFDARPNEELCSRYYSEVVQDEQALAGASESEVGDMFDAWIRQHRRAPTTTARPCPNARFMYCLMLDQETIDNILALPEDPHARRGGHVASEEDEGKLWVKMITNRAKSEGGRWWLRVGLRDYLWPVWFSPSDPDIVLEQMGWEDPKDGVQNVWGYPGDWHRETM